MKHLPWISIGLLALAGCGWNHLPSQDSTWFDSGLWDARDVLAAADGLYVRLPEAGALVRVVDQIEDPYQRIDLGAGRVTRMLGAPDDLTVVAFVDRYTCDVDPDELARMDRIEDCDPEDLEVWTDLNVVRDGALDSALEGLGQYNAMTWSSDGEFAIAYLDFDLGLDLGDLGVVNLTEVLVVDMASGEATPVSVGFAADRVLFTDTDDKAVVLSQSSVAVIDLLAADGPEVDVKFPLTLDADQTVTPVGVELTPDGRYALISVEQSSDLYVLDLENKSVNLVSLSSAPAAMEVDPVADRTVLVYGSRPVADILEHQYFDVEQVQLDEPMTDIIEGDGYALLYNTRQDLHDVYRLDLETGDLLEYRMQNPVISMHLSPSEEFAVALTRAESGFGSGVEGEYDRYPGMEIIDLRDTDRARSFPYVLQGAGVGLAFSGDDTHLYALVLQQSLDYLYQLDLYSGVAQEVELDAPPVSIGSMPEGDFYITHDAGLGLVSFYDPATGDINPVHSFATTGLLTETELIEEEGE